MKNGLKAEAEAIMTTTMEMMRREYNEVTRFFAIFMVFVSLLSLWLHLYTAVGYDISQSNSTQLFSLDG